MQALALDALVAIGGDGSLAIAQQMHEHGIPVVGVPKTIDNDVNGTVLTFGFLSALDCVTLAIDRLHTTAESHSRVMIVEVMGRFAGWIALYGGIAGGADVILVPEVPFRYDSIVSKIREREAAGKHFTMVVVAEGAREHDHGFVTRSTMRRTARRRLGGIGAMVASELEKRTGKEVRACVLGHLQRGGTPSPFDRMLCSMFGTEAIELVAAGAFGQMVAFSGIARRGRAARRGGGEAEDGPARRRHGPHGAGARHLPRILGRGSRLRATGGATRVTPNRLKPEAWSLKPCSCPPAPATPARTPA